MTYTMFEWMQSLDPVKVEQERFAIWKSDQPAWQFQPEPAKPTRQQVQKKEFQATVESITSGLDLNQAQLRAVTNWWKGQEMNNQTTNMKEI